MPVDYSKWDALELSDDSDIEVHPNVDKKSFIRAKQAQIHQDRLQRKHNISTLGYERIINDGLMDRIDRLLTALKSHKANASAQSPEELVFQSLIESAGDPSKDRPPPAPEGVHQHVEDPPTYSKMMAALVDQVKAAIDKDTTKDRYEAFITEVGKHREEVAGLQKQLLAKLAELEKEEKKHITSDNLHTGFDYSSVSKAKQEASSSNPKSVELLNPGSAQRDPLLRADTGQSSGADADVEDGIRAEEEINEDSVRASKLGKEFAKIDMADYRALLRFIQEHPKVLNENETDGLLIEAFNSQIAGQDRYARQCVHQALLLQYCRSLGLDGVQLFFKRVTSPGHKAQALFLDDVKGTYGKIKVKAAEEKARQEKEEEEGAAGVEQIQLQAVDPNTTITVNVPPAVEDPSVAPPELVAAREIFDSFPPGLQRALETGSLDEINKVLAKMSVEEAEEVVENLSNGGMLSVEEGVIDATTEEGRAKMKEIEAERDQVVHDEPTDLAPNPE
ncbi:hsp90-like protein [Eremomyces bilateralis CBS 781.70]|uniref:Hsp90 chaperone protein kinase-targeting subunit n=1 Tax=Eremomyces bilateralis CBS 781.70 TaxID=1392243 RepID=A0A6G1GF79_9PEZI|nr:hsp90-like protein [Eremomyces bilateralis CBS 781.70]KAF1816737.1 hsp90-like protein [Eremomyces bilateralis CBS 781.70]